ncbi:hypothetical protein C8Q78DRAFT_85559 [Trametes maxima]|nr:hypothetical protein C8Q78DRAFT_85559 [Trametes maxima]
MTGRVFALPSLFITAPRVATYQGFVFGPNDATSLVNSMSQRKHRLRSVQNIHADHRPANYINAISSEYHHSAAKNCSPLYLFSWTQTKPSPVVQGFRTLYSQTSNAATRC